MTRGGWRPDKGKVKGYEPGSWVSETLPKTPAADLARRNLLTCEQLSHTTCKWPIGNPGDPGFGFCGETKPLDGKPYCAEHSKRAFTNTGKAYGHRVSATLVKTGAILKTGGLRILESDSEAAA